MASSRCAFSRDSSREFAWIANRLLERVGDEPRFTVHRPLDGSPTTSCNIRYR